MKKISKKFFNYQKNSNKNFKEVENKNIENLKKETEEYNEESSEKVQESEINSVMNETDFITPNEVISTNITLPNYQLKEQNLEFGIIQCSSNYGTFSPFKLSDNNIDIKYKTWISSKNCQYPQYVTMKLINGECFINTIQILFHQYCIPSKVELFLGNYIEMPNMKNNMNQDDYERLLKSFVAIEFERIGYFTLYNNQNINNTARELKLIKIGKKAQYIKLVIYECYKNQSNIYNQVGIISVKVNGIPIIKEEINQNNYSEEINNNKISKSNQPINSNNGIKKSENFSPKRKSTTNIQEEIKNPNFITESSYTNGNTKEKQDKIKRKNIKPNNLTLVNSNEVNEDTSYAGVSEEKNEVTKNTILNTYIGPKQNDNIIHNTEDIEEDNDGSDETSSSVLSVSLSSLSNMINKNNNATTERRKINISPIRNANGKIFSQMNPSDNKNSNPNNDNYNNNNILNNNSSRNNSTRNNSTRNNSTRNNSINDKKKTKSIYDQLDNELDQMINDSSLVLLNNQSNYDEKKDKSKEERKFTESPIHEEKIEKPDASLKTDNGIDSIEQTRKHNKNTFNSTGQKGRELGKYINALEVAKIKAIKNGKNEFSKILNTLLIIFLESQNKINKLLDLRIQAINDKNMDEAENIKANIDNIKDVAIYNLKKNSELVVEQNMDNQEIYIYENEEFEEYEYEESKNDRSFIGMNSMEENRRNIKSKGSLTEIKSNVSIGSKKGSYTEIFGMSYDFSEKDNYTNPNTSHPVSNASRMNSIESRKNSTINNDINDDKVDIPDEKKLEPLHKSVINEFELSISIFSEFVIRSLFSLRFQYKEWALRHILYQLKDNYNQWNSASAKNNNNEDIKPKQEEYIMASIQVLKYSIEDTREKIISISMDLLLLISSIVKNFEFSSLIFNEMDFLTSQLFIKSADMNKRIKECALHTFMKMAFFFHTKPYSIFPYIFRPFNTSIKAQSKKGLIVTDNVSVPLIPWRYAVSRLQLLLDVITKYGISSNISNVDEDNGLTFDNVMKFVIPFFNHQNGKVRNIASSLVAEVSVYIGYNKEEFNSYIKDLNPQILNIIKMKSKALKSERSSSIYDTYLKEQEKNKNSSTELDQQDNETSSVLNYSYDQNIHYNESIIGDYDDQTEELSKMHEKAKNNEINNVNKSYSSKLPTEQTSYIESTVMTRSERNDEISMSNMENSESYLETLNRNHICIFCEEKNEKFNEKTLDNHYRKECPMLINCFRCQLIVEVSNLSNHLLHDCEYKSEYRKCYKCNLAIKHNEREKHIKFHVANKHEDSINGFKSIRCQLCNEIINSKMSLYYNQLDKRNQNRNSMIIIENKMWKAHMQKCKNNTRNKIKSK